MFAASQNLHRLQDFVRSADRDLFQPDAALLKYFTSDRLFFSPNWPPPGCTWFQPRAIPAPVLHEIQH